MRPLMLLPPPEIPGQPKWNQPSTSHQRKTFTNRKWFYGPISPGRLGRSTDQLFRHHITSSAKSCSKIMQFMTDGYPGDSWLQKKPRMVFSRMTNCSSLQVGRPLGRNRRKWYSSVISRRRNLGCWIGWTL